MNKIIFILSVLCLTMNKFVLSEPVQAQDNDIISIMQKEQGIIEKIRNYFASPQSRLQRNQKCEKYNLKQFSAEQAAQRLYFLHYASKIPTSGHENDTLRKVSFLYHTLGKDIYKKIHEKMLQEQKKDGLKASERLDKEINDCRECLVDYIQENRKNKRSY